MERRIVGFHQDDEQHWVAELECGHTQHGSVAKFDFGEKSQNRVSRIQ